MEDTSKRIEFKPPEGFQPPEGTEPGKDWDMVCSFRTKEDGSICMTRLGDKEMPGYGSDEHDMDRDSAHKPGYDRLSNGIMEGMGNTTGGY